MRFYIFIFLFIMTSASMSADSPILDLKEVIRIARENNPTLKAAQEKLNQFDAQKKLSTSPIYPNLTWNLGGTYLKDAVYTGNPKFNGDAYNTYSSDLKLVQPLYSKGLFAAIDVAEYDKKIQVANIDLTERALIQNIIEAFYRFILNQQSLENLLKTQDIIQKSLVTSNQRYQKGRGQLLDILQVKTQLALIQPQVEAAKNQFEIAAQQLINFMGEKEHSDFKLKGQLRTLLLKDVQKYIDLENYHLPEYEVNQLQLTQLDYIRDVTLGKDYPTLRLIGDYLYNNYKKSDLFSDYSHAWAIQLQLSIPLFSGFSSNQEKAILASQNSQLKIARRDLENTLSLKQVTSLKNLETSETSLVTAASAVKLAEESQLEAGRIYKLSQIDFLQFLSVQQAALQAKSSFDLLKFQSIIAYSNYFVATGQPLLKLVDILTTEGTL
ncbi:MAG: TolC family protein [Bacteriovorax sp.]|nr:TolC family protein [Bacteriovorax sp.]